MRTIKVDPNAISLPVYNSASDAIIAEASTTRAKRSLADSSRISGVFVNGFKICDKEICLSLSNEQSLHVFLVGTQVEWRIVDTSDITSQIAEQRFGAVRLLWPSGEESKWDAATLLESRRSFRLDQVFAGQAFINVYFRAGGVLRFSALWNRSDESPLLFVSELEGVPVLEF